MPARIFSVGWDIPGNAAEYIPFRSDRSLFDADVIIFTPTFADYNSHETYAGKSVISEADSQDLVRDCRHWRDELSAAVDAGKTVFVRLVKPVEVYYDTGQRTHSGTGRGRLTTRQVAPASSYDSIPLSFEGLVPRGGTEISVLGDLGPLAAYWHEFGAESEYEVYFDSSGLEPVLGTKKREKVVGGLVRAKGVGALAVLPPLTWDEDALTYMRGKSVYWRKEATALGKRFVNALIAASEAFQREGKRTPVPDWAEASEYSLPTEQYLRDDLVRIDREMTEMAQRRKQLLGKVEEAAGLRWLLYESGKPLELAVIKALRLLGFTAE